MTINEISYLVTLKCPKCEKELDIIKRKFEAQIEASQFIENHIIEQQHYCSNCHTKLVYHVRTHIVLNLENPKQV